MSPPVLTWGDVAAWSQQMRVDPAPWECLALVRMGRLRAEIMGEKPKQGETE